jgi:hypothetical protein
LSEQQQYRTVDPFDRLMGALKNLPDVTEAKPSTVNVVSPLIGDVQTFIIHTFRQREIGDTIFLQYASAGGLVRVPIPPEVSDRIAQQRDALTTKVRKKAAKATAAERKAKGILPGFMKVKKGAQP